jgi:SagB-type dehydrogenase family enzyme
VSEETVFTYHERTKHHFRAFARSLGFMDWATQPNPFRRYEGARLIPLAHVPLTDHPPYLDPFWEDRVPSQPVTRETISRIFYDALSLSAWKQGGSMRWALRINPSSGNLHPTEGYLVTGPTPGLHDAPAVFHYAPKEHGLELRTELTPETWSQLTTGFPRGTFFLGMTSIHWRESWKYGERAYRYCQHDVGHAIACLSLSAGGMGWTTRLMDETGDQTICRLLGLHPKTDSDAEHPDCLIAVVPHGGDFLPPPLAEEIVTWIGDGEWYGVPNVLSQGHHPWPIIEEAAEAAWKPETTGIYSEKTTAPHNGYPGEGYADIPFRKIVHQRRSAVSFDGKTEISRETFYRILGQTMPRPGHVPFSTIPWPPSIHLGLFVHRVRDIPPGIYVLVRDTAKEADLREHLRPDGLWQRPEGCPESLPLYLLEEGNCTQAAAQVSCGQDIAGDGAFSLGMIAEFEETIARYGGWFYRRLFWESGAIGQVLYLEAEAAGIRGTGIGCFFDDPVHQVFGLKGRRYQSLYHFTMGGPVEDPRITTLPPYPDFS